MTSKCPQAGPVLVALAALSVLCSCKGVQIDAAAQAPPDAKVVPFGDAGQLAQQIERLLADANLRESMGLGGYQVALGYASETCCQRIVSELERVVEASGWSRARSRSTRLR